MASPFLLASISTIILCLLCCCHGDLIDDICANSVFISPSRCTKILRSDPHSRGADLRTLGQIAVMKAKAGIRHTAKVARSIRNRDNSRAVRACIEGCRENILGLNEIGKLMLKDLEGRTQGDLPMLLLSVEFDVDTCEDDFMMLDGGEPAKLKKAATIANGLINVIRIIADKL